MIVDEIGINDQQDKENQNIQSNTRLTNILDNTGHNDSTLLDYLFKSGYKVYKQPSKSNLNQYDNF